MPLWADIDSEDEEDILPGAEFEDGKESELICPDCSGDYHLVVRTNRRNGNQFLGCPNWPDCNYTRGIPESWRMERSGQPRLI